MSAEAAEQMQYLQKGKQHSSASKHGNILWHEWSLFIVGKQYVLQQTSYHLASSTLLVADCWDLKW